MQQDQDPGGQLPEEPQSERGVMGTRDKGGPLGAGPTDRPAGTSDADDSREVRDTRRMLDVYLDRYSRFSRQEAVRG